MAGTPIIFTDKIKSLGLADYKHYNTSSKTGHYKKPRKQACTYATQTTKTTSQPPPFIFFGIFATF
jgi:hypothetical protein